MTLYPFVRRCVHPYVIAASLFAIAPISVVEHAAAAQDAQADQPATTGVKPQPVRTPQGRREAVPREARPATGDEGRARAEARPAPAPAPAAVADRAEQPRQAAADQRRSGGGQSRGGNPQTCGAAQRGDRPRGDNPATGQAVPRQSGPAPAQVRPNGGRPNGGRTTYVGPSVRNYYYEPRRYYPYGYGAFGLGYFYYDPYTWYPPSYYGAYDGYGYDNGYYNLGEVRLAVSPRSADVDVDGYIAGRVDSFDGIFQALKLEAGMHHIQMVAPGYLPLDVDIRINPGQKITYRGDLRR
jgi:hypothetical protein